MLDPGPIAVVASHCPDVGPACAAALVRDGFTVVAAGERGDRADPEVRWIEADPAHEAGVDALVVAGEALGPVGVAVTVPGHGSSQAILRSDEATFTAELQQHLTSGFLLARRVAPAMVSARKGRIVFVAPVWGFYGAALRSAHAAASAGLVGLARSLARELGARGVTVNVVAPGLVETQHVREVLAGSRRVAAGIEALVERSALGRVGRPEDVADAVAYLASADAGFLTGAVIPVDGGLALGF